MKLHQLLERAELLPRTRFPKAEALGKTFVSIAVKEYGKGDETYNPEVQAKKLAAKFHKEMINAIDEDLKHRRMKKVGDTGERFRATA